MTKKEALKLFNAENPCENFMLISYRNGKRVKTLDSIMRDQAWNDFTDMLCKNGEITLNQYEAWTHPFNNYKNYTNKRI